MNVVELAAHRAHSRTQQDADAFRKHQVLFGALFLHALEARIGVSSNNVRPIDFSRCVCEYVCFQRFISDPNDMLNCVDTDMYTLETT